MLYNFIIKNITLNILLLTSILILIIFEINEYLQSKNGINTKEAINLINHKNAIIIDIRDEESFKNTNIINSINLPEKNIKKYPNKLNKYKKKQIIIIHYKNNLAQKFIKFLNKMDITNTYYLKDGINNWHKNNLPTRNNIK